MHDLTVITAQLGRYVLRSLRMPTPAAQPRSPPADEHALADRLTSAAEAIRARATRRDQHEQP